MPHVTTKHITHTKYGCYNGDRLLFTMQRRHRRLFHFLVALIRLALSLRWLAYLRSVEHFRVTEKRTRLQAWLQNQRAVRVAAV